MQEQLQVGMTRGHALEFVVKGLKSKKFKQADKVKLNDCWNVLNAGGNLDQTQQAFLLQLEKFHKERNSLYNKRHKQKQALKQQEEVEALKTL